MTYSRKLEDERQREIFQGVLVNKLRQGGIDTPFALQGFYFDVLTIASKIPLFNDRTKLENISTSYATLKSRVLEDKGYLDIDFVESALVALDIENQILCFGDRDIVNKLIKQREDKLNAR